MDVAELNSLDRSDAAAVFAACCGAGVWVDRMIAARPFHDTTEILMTAEEAWWDLGAEDWEEAFAAHSERPGSSAFPEYEKTFGYPYIVSTTDRSPEELDALYRRRLGRDPLSELSGTASEQARMTNLALRRVLDLA